MRRLLMTAAALLPMGFSSLGCNDSGGRPGATTRTVERTTTTQTAPPPAQSGGSAPTAGQPGKVDVGVNSNGTGPSGRAATNNGAVGVDVTPNGGVDVEVQGEPLRDRLRERRAARIEAAADAPLPR